MAGPYKGTLFLATKDAGWTETYYHAVASLASAQTALQNIITPRLALARIGDVTILVARVVDMSAPRTAILFTPTSTAGTWSGADLSTVDPALALLTRMNSADGLTRSRHFLRGIPSAQLSGSASDPITWAMTAGFITAFNAWITAVIANAVLAVRKPPAPIVTKAISAINASALGTIRRAGRPFVLRRGRRMIV